MPLFGPPDVEKLKARRDIAGLIKALSYQKDPNVRQSAAVMLGELRDAQAVEPLISLLKDAVIEVRKSSIEALGQIADARAVEPIIAALKDMDESSRRVADEFWKLPETLRGSKSLLTNLLDRDRSVYTAAAEALVRIGDKALENNEIALRRSIMGKLFNDVKPDCDILIKVIENDKDEQILEAAILYCRQHDMLGCLGKVDKSKQDRVINVLIPLLKGAAEFSEADSRSPYNLQGTRFCKIIEALGSFSGQTVVDTICDIAIRCREVKIKEAALKTLGIIDDPRAFPSIFAVFVNETNRGFFKDLVVKLLIEMKVPGELLFNFLLSYLNSENVSFAFLNNLFAYLKKPMLKIPKIWLAITANTAIANVKFRSVLAGRKMGKNSPAR